MFSLLNGVYDSYLAPSQLNLLVVGAPSVGKTTLLERLKVTQMPKRPSSKPSGSQTLPSPLTAALHEAFAKGGAEAPPNASSPEAVNSPDKNAVWSWSSTSSPTAGTTPSPVVQKPTSLGRLRLSICPAPKRYTDSAEDQEEDFIIDESAEPTTTTTTVTGTTTAAASKGPYAQDLAASDKNKGKGTQSLGGDIGGKSPAAPKRVRCHSKEFSMDELDLINADSATAAGAGAAGTGAGAANRSRSNHQMSSMESIPLEEVPPFPSLQPHAAPTTSISLVPSSSPANDNSNSPLLQEGFDEVDIRPKAKMLPMSKIRPTIGTNLGKIDMYGAKCHCFDVGGRLQDLWERYYDDCDAVIFCWKLGDDPEEKRNNSNNEGEEEEVFDMAQQQQILNDVRKSIPDDVPFLIFGHVFGNANVDLVGQMYSTDLLLPHYHNNLTGLCCGSAKTGAGVQHAMEWLIPLAKRQQKERLAARKQLEEKEV